MRTVGRLELVPPQLKIVEVCVSLVVHVGVLITVDNDVPQHIHVTFVDLGHVVCDLSVRVAGHRVAARVVMQDIEACSPFVACRDKGVVHVLRYGRELRVWVCPDGSGHPGG